MTETNVPTFGTAERLRNWLSGKYHVEVVEGDMNPDNPQMGRCQFLVHVSDDEVLEQLEGSDADCVRSRMGGAYTVALPPEE